jgi:hypothetical protein
VEGGGRQGDGSRNRTSGNDKGKHTYTLQTGADKKTASLWTLCVLLNSSMASAKGRKEKGGWERSGRQRRCRKEQLLGYGGCLGPGCFVVPNITHCTNSGAEKEPTPPSFPKSTMKDGTRWRQVGSCAWCGGGCDSDGGVCMCAGERRIRSREGGRGGTVSWALPFSTRGSCIGKRTLTMSTVDCSVADVNATS